MRKITPVSKIVKIHNLEEPDTDKTFNFKVKLCLKEGPRSVNIVAKHYQDAVKQADPELKCGLYEVVKTADDGSKEKYIIMS